MNASFEFERFLPSSGIATAQLDHAIDSYLREGGKIDHIAWAVTRDAGNPATASYRGYPIKFTTFAPDGAFGIRIVGDLADY